MSEDNTIPEEKWSVRPGEKFGLLTVKSEPFYVRYKDTNRRLQHAMFQCDCGTTKELGCYEVKQGRVKSCGCLLVTHTGLRFRKGTLSHNGQKKCSRCLETKGVEFFGFDRYTKDGIHSVCKDCKKNIELLHEFGITLKQYNEQLRLQNGCCACCGSASPGGNGKYFAVDHSHVTGKIRGLLCFHCNTGLGHFFDSTSKLEDALDYLRRTS